MTQSITITLPKQWNKEIALAVLDTYIEGLERGYRLTIEKQSEQEPTE